MDYRILMLQEPNEIKKILDEFGGRLGRNKKRQKKGWMASILGRIVRPIRNERLAA